MIGCLYLPHFPAAVERSLNPALAGAPFALVGYSSAQGRVYAASAEAHTTGIQRDMTIRQAQILCPDVQVYPAALRRYQQALDAILYVLRDYANKVEPVKLTARQAQGLIYLDLGKLRQTDALFLSNRLLDNLNQRSAWNARLGLAKSKFTAMVAACTQFATSVRIVAPDEEAPFLAPLPLDLLPMGKEMLRYFHLLGIHTIGQLAALPSPAVFNQFGKHGLLMHRLARGRDERRVRPHKFEPVLHQSHVFDPPVDDRQIIERVVRQQAEKLHAWLAQDALGTQQITLMLNLEDRTQVERTLNLPEPVSRSEGLTWNLCYLAQRLDAPCAVTGVEVYLNQLSPLVPKQLSLFDELEDIKRVSDVLISLVHRYGSDPFVEVTPRLPGDTQPERRFWLEPVEPDQDGVA